ncbi:hypothetical protein H696_03076 [Fonticula alba]|uniref:Uncharacterized protein n=1 Tax=Fonticula alba TaxID=691883 RepID=A0A058Z8X5_FONAL|nr:hypothetical protein H696_03076 [Fonticula alba]KCV70725.1 hypothetical protein H696_03076 [Fonticula alba]|eukprot:XP_009495241.1 hypothetical protein H696_03076 [Fonticula alba]
MLGTGGGPAERRSTKIRTHGPGRVRRRPHQRPTAHATGREDPPGRCQSWPMKRWTPGCLGPEGQPGPPPGGGACRECDPPGGGIGHCGAQGAPGAGAGRPRAPRRRSASIPEPHPRQLPPVPPGRSDQIGCAEAGQSGRTRHPARKRRPIRWIDGLEPGAEQLRPTRKKPTRAHWSGARANHRLSGAKEWESGPKGRPPVRGSSPRHRPWPRRCEHGRRPRRRPRHARPAQMARHPGHSRCMKPPPQERHCPRRGRA